jgi:uncharacterized membrane protein
MSTQTDFPQSPAPSQEECSNAMLMYILSIFSGFLAPLIFFLVKRDSRFVSFHSLQALIWHAVYVVLFGTGMLVAFGILVTSAAMHPHPAPREQQPLELFGVFGFMWLLIAGGSLLNLILGIVYGIKASRGEWARIAVIGNLVLRGILPPRPAA